jgi:CheY-like chemotaxis protein
MLLTDIVMPGGMSGWELADLARRLRSNLPVVFSSGYALDTLVDKGLASARAFASEGVPLASI